MGHVSFPGGMDYYQRNGEFRDVQGAIVGISHTNPWKITWKNNNLKMYLSIKNGDFPTSHVSLLDGAVHLSSMI